MTNDEVTRLFNWIRQEKRPQLFPKKMDDKTYKVIIREWDEKLKPFSLVEVYNLFRDGYYMKRYNYDSSVIDDLVRAAKYQRWECSPAGVAYREQQIKEWNERIRGNGARNNSEVR